MLSNNPARAYTARERALFALFSARNNEIDTLTLVKRYYGASDAFWARQIVVGALNGLARKLIFNKEPFLLKKSQRAGPNPVVWWIEPA